MSVRGSTNPNADGFLHELFQRVLTDTDGLELWWAIGEVFGRAVQAESVEVFLNDQSGLQRLLVRVAQLASPNGLFTYTRDRVIPIKSGVDYLPVAAIRHNRVLSRVERNGRVKFAVPLTGHPDWNLAPMAVVVLRINPDESVATLADSSRVLGEVARGIWPACVYAGLRFPKLRLMTEATPAKIVDAVLDTLCNRLGFEFATISLLDEDHEEIRAVDGRLRSGGKPKWINDAHHACDLSQPPNDHDDIQVKVLRTGKSRIVKGWDDDLDRHIYDTFNHERYIRIFTPLISPIGPVGTIEAGFDREIHKDVHPLLQAVLEHYAQIDVAVAIQNALLYQRDQAYAMGLIKLHETGYKLQVRPRSDTTSTWLKRLTSAGVEVLKADLVMLYLYKPESGTFLPPIYSGRLRGGAEDLLPPQDSDNIVQLIGRSRASSFESDAAAVLGRPGSGGAERTFTERQGVRSFAGAPLLAGEKLLGVLCANYQQRQRFSDREMKVFELFAQQAAAMLISDQLVRDEERRRLEFDLHDAVKSKICGLMMLSEGFAIALSNDDTERAKDILGSLQHYGQEILSDVDVILDNMAATGDNGRTLHELILKAVSRLAQQGSTRVVTAIDSDLGTLVPIVPSVLALNFLYLLEQAVTNAQRHARAQQIDVAVSYVDGCLHLAVEDDGRGVGEVDSQGQLVRGSTGRGLRSMRERARRLGGILEIRERQFGGTAVRVAIPIAGGGPVEA